VGSDQLKPEDAVYNYISIHAPRVGSDAKPNSIFISKKGISIHAPRVGSDRAAGPSARSVPHFNPRSPRGERPPTSISMLWWLIFQSTLPAWGATLPADGFLSGAGDFNPRSPRGERRTPEGVSAHSCLIISIHAPRVGSDNKSMRKSLRLGIFQSTLPAWGATPARYECY